MPLRGQKKAKETRGTAAEQQRSTMKQAGAARRAVERSASSTVAYEARLEDKLAKERAIALLARRQAREQAAEWEALDAEGGDGASGGGREGEELSGGGGGSGLGSGGGGGARHDPAELTRMLAESRARAAGVLIAGLSGDFHPERSRAAAAAAAASTHYGPAVPPEAAL